MKCPDCGHDLRRVSSLTLDLCDQCGYRQPFEPEPPVPTIPRKSQKTQAIELGIKIAGFAVIGAIATWGISTAIAARNTARLEAEAKSKVQEIEAMIAAEKAKNIDISSLPKTCQPTDYVKMDIDIINNCLRENLTVGQLSQIAGQPGEVSAKNNNVEIRRYPETYGSGTLLVTFIDGRLDSYSQAGFNSSPPLHRR